VVSGPEAIVCMDIINHKWDRSARHARKMGPDTGLALRGLFLFTAR